MRGRLTVVYALAFLILGVAAPVAAQSRSVFWRQWDVRIDNVDTTDNTFDVAEFYTIDFSGTFQFGSVAIPYTNLEDISNIQVYQNGQALRASCSEQRGTYCVSTGSGELSITYYFVQPITDDSSRFEIGYTVEGALRIYDGGDQLWWTAVPTEHFGFSIGSSTITVEMPEGFAPREGIDPVETYGAPADVNVQGMTITATAREQLTGDDYFEIRVQYPHDPNATAPAWQNDFDETRLYEETTKPLIDLGLLALSLLLLIGGLMAVYALWYTRGRDPKVGPVPEYLSEPPSNLPPAVVGTLLDEKADLRDIISTIIDLARRGYIVMEEVQNEGLFGMTSTSFVFKRTDKAGNDLLSFEMRMLNALFSSGRMERSLDSLTNNFYSYIPQLQKELYQHLLQDELFTTSPESTRTAWSGFGGLLLGAAFVFVIFGFDLVSDISGAIICLPFSVGAVGVLALIVGQHMPAKTRKGAEEAAKWNAFREYLRNLEKYGSVEEAAQHFDDYLAYAIAFGIDRSWVRRFSQLQSVPIPTWYYPYWYHRPYIAGTPVNPPSFGGGIGPGDLARAGGGGLDDISGGMSRGLESISDGLSNMLNSASRAMTSRPQQSSGGSGRWSSGGRGWSGGGFGGGGSSGGGSRGFG
jgi:uncharacterized membrane protein YgcG